MTLRLGSTLTHGRRSCMTLHVCIYFAATTCNLCMTRRFEIIIIILQIIFLRYNARALLLVLYKFHTTIQKCIWNWFNLLQHLYCNAQNFMKLTCWLGLLKWNENWLFDHYSLGDDPRPWLCRAHQNKFVRLLTCIVRTSNENLVEQNTFQCSLGFLLYSHSLTAATAACPACL